MTHPQDVMKEFDWESVARLFHDTYEELAPKFGYKTRPDTKQFDSTSKNGRLMMAVVERVLSQKIAEAEQRMKMELHQTLGKAMRQENGKWIVEISDPLAKIFLDSVSPHHN